MNDSNNNDECNDALKAKTNNHIIRKRILTIKSVEKRNQSC